MSRIAARALRYLMHGLAVCGLLWCLAGLSHAQSDISGAAGDDPAASVQASELRAFASPRLRSRYYVLVNELRCPKCQNQNLADSDAPIAADLRNELFELLHEGYTNQQIRDFMTARYGSFVLYQPPFGGYTAALWLLPVALLAMGGLLVWRITRPPASGASASLDPAAQARDSARLENLEQRMTGAQQAEDDA